MTDEILYDFDTVFYLSFTDPDRPKGTQWLGGAYLPALSNLDAVIEAHRLGCNPGGEVMMWGPFPRALFREDHLGRLLDEQGIETAAVE